VLKVLSRVQYANFTGEVFLRDLTRLTASQYELPTHGRVLLRFSTVTRIKNCMGLILRILEVGPAVHEHDLIMADDVRVFHFSCHLKFDKRYADGDSSSDRHIALELRSLGVSTSLIILPRNP
jgi:hypothetical protein